jgi:tRNA 2-thiouridine synthesizing protein A
MCPMPVLKAKKALRDVKNGGILQVLATDPGSVADMKAFCEMTGNRLISSKQDGNVFIYHIEKAGD